MSDNKLYWKVIKPSLSNKSCVKDQINLVEKGEILKTNLETAKVLNTFFKNKKKIIEINQYSNFDALIINVEDPNLRAILRYKDHPSILAIQNKYKNRNKFAFEKTVLASMEKETRNLKIIKASQISDISTRILTEHIDIFCF